MFSMTKRGTVVVFAALTLIGLLAVAFGPSQHKPVPEPAAGNLGDCDSAWMTYQIKAGVALYTAEGPTSIHKMEDVHELRESSEYERRRCVGDTWWRAVAGGKNAGMRIISWTAYWTNAEKTKWQIDVNIPANHDPIKLKGNAKGAEQS